ncbi:MAG: hypothetical protein GX620_10935 [Chloroflexi bacterium]|nr:hypothetical protein [Chloroflexota bacterium]
MPQIAQVLEHFLSRAAWVDRQNTVDRIIIGDAEPDVDRCLVTWMPSLAALKVAVEEGYKLVVCHEPTFWEHWDRHPEENPRAEAKLRFIADHGLTIMRNHDCWDRWPDIGIPWAWARFLDMPETPAAVGGDGYQHRYDLGAVTLDALASHIADRCASLGEPSVQVTGRATQSVSRVGLGTGCCCNIGTFIDMGCNCSVVCDDGSSYWRDVQMAEDLGHPVIRVNHGTSEEPGMVTLASYINECVPGLSAQYLPHICTYRLVHSY